MRIVRPVVAALLLVGGLLLVGAGPAFGCSCRADRVVAEEVARSDGAFVGVFTGRDFPDPHADAVNHFQVERTVKGDIGERVDVRASASGAECGLELAVGARTGLLVGRNDAGAWASSLCAVVEPQALLAVAPAEPASSSAGPDWGFIVFAAVVVLAVPVALVLSRRRPPSR